MTTVAIRKKLADYIKIADDKKIKAMYALLEDDIELGGSVSIEQYGKELEQADAEIEAGDFVLHEDVVKYFSKK
jgi:hypothetical protein